MLYYTARCVNCAQKLTTDLKLSEQDNELLRQKLDASKARYRKDFNPFTANPVKALHFAILV